MARRLCGIRAALLVSAALCGLELAGSEARGQQSRPEENHPQQGQDTSQESFKIKVDVALVMTDVTVIGTAVPELQAEDFLIFDNGTSQQLSHFSRGLLPLAVTVLIDTSLSVQPYLPILQIAAGSALRQFKPEDQVALYSFNANAARLCDLTYDRVGSKLVKLP